jgi:hypothetical protein
MTEQDEQPVAVNIKKQVEETKERAVKAAEEATRAREAQAMANKEVDEVNDRIKKATAEIKSAIEAEATLKSKARLAQDGARKATEGAKKAAEIESEARRAAEQASNKLIAEEAKIAKKAKSEAQKRAAQAVKEQTKHEVEETKERTVKAAEEAKETAKTKQVAEQAFAELYSGVVTLMIAPPVHYEQIRNFKELLDRVKDIRVVLVGGSVDEGNMIVISAQQPIPLLTLFSELPIVQHVSKKDKGIEITLKAV